MSVCRDWECLGVMKLRASVLLAAAGPSAPLCDSSSHNAVSPAPELSGSFFCTDTAAASTSQRLQSWLSALATQAGALPV